MRNGTYRSERNPWTADPKKIKSFRDNHKKNTTKHPSLKENRTLSVPNQKKNTVPPHNFENCYENILVENELPTSSWPIKNELNRFTLLIEIFAIILHHCRPFISSSNWRKSPIDGFSLSVEEPPRGTNSTTKRYKGSESWKTSDCCFVWYR